MGGRRQPGQPRHRRVGRVRAWTTPAPPRLAADDRGGGRWGGHRRGRARVSRAHPAHRRGTRAAARRTRHATAVAGVPRLPAVPAQRVHPDDGRGVDRLARAPRARRTTSCPGDRVVARLSRALLALCVTSLAARGNTAASSVDGGPERSWRAPMAFLGGVALANRVVTTDCDETRPGE